MPVRRSVLFASLALTGIGARSQGLSADWPSKAITLVVSGSAGGAPDLFARHYAEQLTRLLGKPVVIDNKPGAAGGLAATTVAQSTDRHTLMWGFSSIFGINPHLYPKGAIDLRKDLVPVAPTVKQGLALVVNNDFPVNTLDDLVKLARSQPGKIPYASYGIAGYPHLTMEVLQETTKIKMIHVPYKQKAIIDVMGGQVPMVVEPISTAMPLIKAKKVKALAFTLAQRHPSLPEVPTFAETYPVFGEIAGIHGVWAPASLPREIVQRLNTAMDQVTAMPETAAKLAELSCVPYGGNAEQLAAVVEAEYTRWGRVIRDNNIKPE